MLKTCNECQKPIESEEEFGGMVWFKEVEVPLCTTCMNGLEWNPSKPLKCYKCKFFWYMLPCNESPYGESACMKKEQDLWGAKLEDVESCGDFESK